MRSSNMREPVYRFSEMTVVDLKPSSANIPRDSSAYNAVLHTNGIQFDPSDRKEEINSIVRKQRRLGIA